MANPTGRSAGWLRIPNAAAGVAALGIYTQDPAERVPYVFGLGADDTGRIATGSRAGAALTIPDAYGFGEMIELRYTFAETGNSQRQGIFMDVRTSAANSSTVRGMEISAQSEGNIDVGVLSGGAFKAIPRGTSGTITAAYGVEGEVTHNAAAWAGTMTTAAAVRGKFTMEDGAAYTNSSVFLAEVEAATGGDTIGSYFRGNNISGITASQLFDFTGCTLTVSDTDKVTLMKFARSDGTAVFMRYDTSDNALVFATS